MAKVDYSLEKAKNYCQIAQTLLLAEQKPYRLCRMMEEYPRDPKGMQFMR